MKSNKKLFAILTLMMFMMTLVPMVAFGATVTPAGATSFAAGAGATALAGNIVITEAAAGEIGVGDIVITAPAGVTFDTATTPDAAFSVGAGMTFDAAGIAVTSSTITIPVTAASTTQGVITIGGVTKPRVISNVAGSYNLTITASGLASANCAPINVAVAAAGISTFNTVVEQDVTTQTADGTSVATITVYGYDAYNNVIASPFVTVVSNRGTNDIFTAGSNATLAAAQTAHAAADAYGAQRFDATAALGYLKFKVSTNTPGVADIYIAVKDNVGGAGTESVYDYFLDQTAAKGIEAGFVKKVSVTFTAPGADNIVIGSDAVPSDAGTLLGTAAGTSANPWETTGAVGEVNGNGIDTYELAFKVVASNNAPVAGATMDFSVSDSALTLNKTTATTDGAGVAKVKVSATKPGTFSVKATSGSKDLSQYVKFLPNAAYTVKLISDNNQKVAKDSDFSFKLKLEDQAGNKITATAAATGAAIKAANQGLAIKAETKPSDVALVEDITAGGAAYSATVESDGYLKVKIAGTQLNKEGAYALKCYFDNGQSATVDFTVHTQGTVTTLTVAYDQTTVPMNTAVASPTVKRVDANGVSRTVSLASNEVTFTVSDVRLVKAGTVFGTNTGAFTTSNDKNLVGALTITAVDTNKNLTASTVINIQKQTNGFTLTPPAGTTQASTNATVNLQFVDVEGAPIAISDATAVDYTFYTVSKPAGSIVSTGSPGTKLDDVKKTGKAALTVKSNVPGEVQLQVLAKITGGSSAGSYTANTTVKFGTAASTEVIGAKTVTMFIGATGFVQDGTAKVTDVAPFIQDSRTFVAVRPVADAFGAEIGWDEATQTVTLTRTDMTLTIVIGSNTITKVADGVTTTTEADVAAFIKDGRTVLPFRAVGEAFGATVSYDAATQAVSFVQ